MAPVAQQIAQMVDMLPAADQAGVRGLPDGQRHQLGLTNRGPGIAPRSSTLLTLYFTI